MEKVDIHGRTRRRQRIEEQLNEATDILPENKTLILEYVDDCTVGDDISPMRAEKLISNLWIYGRFLGKNFREADRADISRISKQVYALPLADSTKNGYCKILKKFYTWLRQDKHPKETDWLNPPKVKIEKLDPQQRLYWEDVIQLSTGARNPRDFLLPQAFFDSGMRVEELISLRRKNAECVIEEPNTTIRLHLEQSKTTPRIVEVVKSVPAFMDWLEKMPNKDPEAFIFSDLETNTQPMGYKHVRFTLIEMGRRSGLKKKMNPHFFRKSACSYCADLGMSETQLCARFGWSIGSKILKNYCFPDEKKTNARYAELQGKKPVVEENTDPVPRKCPFCKNVNPMGVERCVKCGKPMITDEIQELILMKFQAYIRNIHPEVSLPAR
jgi:integrase/recombinase XerD